jgi:hypothetical protein
MMLLHDYYYPRYYRCSASRHHRGHTVFRSVSGWANFLHYLVRSRSSDGDSSNDDRSVSNGCRNYSCSGRDCLGMEDDSDDVT